MLPESITKRALELIMSNHGLDILKAVEQSILEEQKLITELIEQKSERSIKLKSAMRKKVYAEIALMDAKMEISKF